MKLETKLNLSTAWLVLIVCAGAGMTTAGLNEVVRLAWAAHGQREPFVMKLKAMQGEVVTSVACLEAAALSGDKAADAVNYRAEAVEARKRALADLADAQELGRSVMSGPGREQLNRLEEQVRSLERWEEDTDAAQVSQGLAVQRLVPLAGSIRDSTAKLLADQEALVEGEHLAVVRRDHEVVWWLWAVAFLGAASGVAISAVIARQSARAVRLIGERAAAVAAGDLRGGELGITTNDQIESLAWGMRRMQEGLAGIIGTVAETAGTLAGSADSMRVASEKVHKRIDQQSQQTQQAASAMQEMSASIAEVSRHTQSAAETARNAAQTARDGGLIVKQVLGSMQSIAEAVTETSTTVGLLGEDSRRISQIVTVIEEIARKTNLLALNAAIEAARAGEQGRGFAVVAGEVRRLAESTAQATGEIERMVQEIQDRTRTAIASMDAGTGTVRDGVVTTTRAGEALERIIGMAECVDRMITQIAIAASQQAAAADQSSASLDSIYSLSHENLQEMATTAAGIESLRGTAIALERQVDRFQMA